LQTFMSFGPLFKKSNSSCKTSVNYYTISEKKVSYDDFSVEGLACDSVFENPRILKS